MAIPVILLDHLRAPTCALLLPRGGSLQWPDMEFHRAAYESDPEQYALLALAPGVQQWQRARVLLQLLAGSQAGLEEPVRGTLARVSRVLSLSLPPADAITVLLALRRLRANHKHTTRAVLRFVLEHPDADALIAARRRALVDCFEHALGKTAARGCAHRVATGDTGSDYLQRRLLRFLTTEPGIGLRRVRALYADHLGRAVAAGRPDVARAVDAAIEVAAVPRPRGRSAAPLEPPLRLDDLAGSWYARPPGRPVHTTGPPDAVHRRETAPEQAVLLERLAAAERRLETEAAPRRRCAVDG